MCCISACTEYDIYKRKTIPPIILNIPFKSELPFGTYMPEKEEYKGKRHEPASAAGFGCRLRPVNVGLLSLHDLSSAFPEEEAA
jgi:hypothetical protein